MISLTRRAFLGSTLGLGVGMAFGKDLLAQDVNLGASGKMLTRIDCTQEYPPEHYFCFGEVKVVDSTAGRYREAEGKPLSRIGYKFTIENLGKPHVAVIRFPDDKRRFMCIMDGTTYDLTTGLFTGWEQPLTGQIQELRQVFWPRWKECSIVFMTWSEGEPAAVASIEIWELDSLPALEIPNDPNDGSRREIGIQYEDPCGCGASEGAITREEWIDHVVAYARHTGQGLLAYPMAWYHGPQFPSEREPADGFGMAVTRDRLQYSRWTTHPEDWYASLLERFAQEGLAFQGALTLLRLGSLMQKMNIDLDAIKNGAETFNNMLNNDQVQSSTNDWTPIYNARNFNRLAEAIKGKPPMEPWSLLPEWVYGERRTPGAHTGAMFNPLHPTVQEAILGFVREIGQRYAKFLAFRGISFNMFASAMPWFGSIDSGYDDYTIALFSKETDIEVPVYPKAHDRFSKRFKFLTETHRETWVHWRCKKIRALFSEIRRALAESREDLRVTITLWDETTVTNVLGQDSAGLQLYERPSMVQFYREAGIDITLYGDEPGLEVDRGMGNGRDRGGHGSNPCGGTTLPIEAQTMYRDFDYLDQEALDAFHDQDHPGAFIFNCWVEAWGKHVWFEPEADDPNLAEMSLLDGKPADGVVRINSEYPKDGFWWNSQLRITPGFPSPLHFLEPYAHAVAELDACRITRGGLFLDKAHTDQLRSFTRAYRALPRRKFDTLGAKTDPVAVRTLLYENQRYFYVINRDYYPVAMRIDFDTVPKNLRDLATNQPLAADAAGSFQLGSYELRVFSMAPECGITGFSANPPAEIWAEIQKQVQQAFDAFDKLRASDRDIPGMEPMRARMALALKEQHTAFLRRALGSRIVRRALADSI